jgi:segregation and condensation protein A
MDPINQGVRRSWACRPGRRIAQVLAHPTDAPPGLSFGPRGRHPAAAATLPGVRLRRLRRPPRTLLLFLIRKNEIDIFDIPIEKVSQQFLEILRAQEKDNLEAPGDFFVAMAATLMYSCREPHVLPVESRPGRGSRRAAEDGQDPAPAALVQQLIQYKRVKETAAIIRGLVDERQGLLGRHVIQPQGDDALVRPVAPPTVSRSGTPSDLVLRRLAERIQPGNIYHGIRHGLRPYGDHPGPP